MENFPTTNSNYQHQHQHFDTFNEEFMNLKSSDDHHELMNNVDSDNIYTIVEKDVQDYETDQMDMMDDSENQTFIPLKPLEEHILSQKMNRLSTNTTNEKETLLKDIKIEIEKIPNYLTKQNKSFKQMLHQVLSTMNTIIVKNNMEELRKIAILIYKIMFIQTYHTLWMTYLESGMGKLISQSQELPPIYPTNLPIWPKQVKAILKPSTKTDKTDKNTICNTFVNNYLHELDGELKKYQIELNIKINNFNGYTLTIRQMLKTYIETNLRSFRMKIQHEIELIHYDYHIRALKLEYLRQNPNKYQKQLMFQVCESKYAHELTEQEYHLLTQQITYYNLPNQSFECSSIASCPLIDSIQNSVTRQELYKQYKQVAEQSRIDLFDVYLRSAEEQREEYRKKYEDDFKRLSHDHCSSDDKENVPPPPMMIQLIKERCNKISERIKCIYKFKTESIILNIK